MTILNPSQQNSNRKTIKLIALIFSALLLTGAFYIHQYTRLADLRYRQESLRSALSESRVLNSDLKNQLYRLTASEAIQKEALAERLGRDLVLEGNPGYFNFKNNQWASVSQ